MAKYCAGWYHPRTDLYEPTEEPTRRMTIKPRVMCFAAPVTSDGRPRGSPLLVNLSDAEWLFRDRGWAIVGPDPSDLEALARWEREQLLPRST